MLNKKQEKIIYVFLIALMILIVGVQIGIHHGRELQRQDDLQEFYGYICAN